MPVFVRRTLWALTIVAIGLGAHYFLFPPSRNQVYLKAAPAQKAMFINLLVARRVDQLYNQEPHTPLTDPEFRDQPDGTYWHMQVSETAELQVDWSEDGNSLIAEFKDLPEDICAPVLFAASIADTIKLHRLPLVSFLPIFTNYQTEWSYDELRQITIGDEEFQSFDRRAPLEMMSFIEPCVAAVKDGFVQASITYTRQPDDTPNHLTRMAEKAKVFEEQVRADPIRQALRKAAEMDAERMRQRLEKRHPELKGVELQRQTPKRY